MSELDAIADRALAATPGPWEAVAFDSGHSKFEMSVSVVTEWHGDAICDMDGLTRAGNEFYAKNDGFADAVFIAATREDVPKMVTALRAILALHERVDAEQFYNDASGASRSNIVYVCGHCEHNTAYPCETVLAITQALEAVDE